MDSYESRLDVLCHETARIPIARTFNPVDDFLFTGRRDGLALVFEFEDILIKVYDFQLVDEDWHEGSYFASPQGDVRYLYYSAMVSWRVGQLKGEDRVMLGYFKDREKLLAPLPRSWKWEAIDTLLSRLDKTAANFFHVELLAPEESKDVSHEQSEARPLPNSF
jgi:hypothetical protein